MKRTLRAFAAVTATATLALLTAACGGGDDKAGGSAEIQYWLWADNQKQQYQMCADAFHQANPQYTVKITQTGINDYWQTLTTNMVSGTAPDVFMSRLANFPQLVAQHQIMPISDQIKKANIDLSGYQSGLADLWVAQDGKRYGLPKDFDTVGIVYNTKLAQDAGLTADQLANLTWNPQDGGTYEKAIAHLTVDTHGVRGDQPGFDKAHVATYGLGINSSGGGSGQTQWSMYALSTGWDFANQNPWATKFNYADPRFKQTIAWLKSMMDKGYVPNMAVIGSGVSSIQAYGAGKYAMVTDGDWNVKTYWDLKGVTSALAPTPVGPAGKRATLFNGTADNIYSGTKNPDAAWAWVNFLGSAACQDIVASQGVVFPAVKTSTTKSIATFKAQGIDTTAFTSQVDQGTTHLYPIADHWSDINSTMTETLDSILSNKSSVDSLDSANDKINKMFQ